MIWLPWVVTLAAVLLAGRVMRRWRFMRGGGGRGLWLYTPSRVTDYFGAGGWIALDARWLWSKFRYERERRARRRQSRAALPQPEKTE